MSEQQNRITKSIEILITIPLSESQPETPSTKSTCGNCSSCSNGKQASECGPLMQHAGKILMTMFGGKYTPQQMMDGFEMLDALLRRHYSKSP